MSNILVTGGAGFIGSHLVENLVTKHKVTVIDNLSSGKLENLHTKAKFEKKDLLTDQLIDLFKNQDMVFHCAANPDVKVGVSNTLVHIEQNIIGTYRVLETMRQTKVRKIVFTSSSTVYGEALIPTPENYGPLVPTSLYGASKLAGEALISSYCHTFDFQAWIFRLANVIGPRSNHGVICDFMNKLRANPVELEILGNGKQAKSYVHIDDCVVGILQGLKANDKVNIINLGSSDHVTVEKLASIVCEEMRLTPIFKFTGGTRGWQGDIPIMLLSTDILRHLGWEPSLSSEQAARATAKGLISL